MSEMSGKMIENKPLYVAVAQRKEDRRARLQVCSLKIASYSKILSFLALYSWFKKRFMSARIYRDIMHSYGHILQTCYNNIVLDL